MQHDPPLVLERPQAHERRIDLPELEVRVLRNIGPRRRAVRSEVLMHDMGSARPSIGKCVPPEE